MRKTRRLRLQDEIADALATIALPQGEFRGTDSKRSKIRCKILAQSSLTRGPWQGVGGCNV